RAVISLRMFPPRGADPVQCWTQRPILSGVPRIDRLGDVARNGVGFGRRSFCCTFPCVASQGASVFGEGKTSWQEVDTLHYRGAWRGEPPKRQVQGHLLQASRPTKPNPTRAHQD